MNSFDKRYNNLNIHQRQAVDTLEGPVLVVAGPGAGKTELLSIRIANILKVTDTLPSSILCLTFTDAAAKNMRDRLFGLIGPDAYKVAIHTFHSFGTEIISRNGEFFWNYASLQPADDVVAYEILQEIVTALPERDPLRSQHPVLGFTFLRDIKSNISELKKGGITPAEFALINEANAQFLQCAESIIVDFFAGRITKKDLALLPKLIEDLLGIHAEPIPAHIGVKTMQEVMVLELKELLLADSTPPLTLWKKKYTTKKADKSTTLKDLHKVKKYRSLAHVYEQYSDLLYKKGYFDFDDMLLKVVQSMEEYPELRYNLAEQYHYIMLDEFQDTNGVQMRFVRDIVSETPGGSPNILAVGDDDQAVYKFQGASLANILSFNTMFGETAVITLVDNYRSTQGILDMATEVIEQSSERLTDRIPDLNKILTSHSQQEEHIESYVFEDELSEALWVVQQIERIHLHSPDDSIAVIVRNHGHLDLTMRALNSKHIPFVYERKNNILKEPLIQQIITLVRFATKMMDLSAPYDESELPDILAMPVWGVDANAIWEIALAARRERKGWFDTISSFSDPKVKEISSFLKALGKASLNTRLEDLLFMSIGSMPVQVDGIDYFSPFKEHYFGAESKQNFLHLLAILKVFLDAICNHKKTETLYAQDLLDFVAVRERFNLALSNVTPLQKSTATLMLLTAHKAKGQEYDHVFVIRANKEDWVGQNKGSKLSLPSNIFLGPEKDNIDDKCRLLFVAMTRAKKHLCITRFDTNLAGKSQHQIPFINEFTPMSVDAESSWKEAVVEDSILKPEMTNRDAFKDKLQELLQNYSLTATHLQRFINIIDEGPSVFLEKSILAFPSVQSSTASYGVAIHAALQKMIISARMNKVVPTTKEVQEYFAEALLKERLIQDDYLRMIERGNEVLEKYLEEKAAGIDPSDKVEVRFSTEEVYVGGAHISGVIDRLHLNTETKEAVVTDYKTGKAQVTWTGNGDYEKWKLFKFKLQLYFYKFLVEGSASYGSQYKVIKGQIDFVETREDKLYALELYYDTEEEERYRKLIEIVYSKVLNLDFPDISIYPKKMEGIYAFIDDLLDGKI